MFNTMFNHDKSITAICGHSGLITGDNAMFNLIQSKLDYHHGDTSGRDLGYCVEYQVSFNAPSWTTGQWFNVVGVTADGSLVDLLSIGYTYQYSWLTAGVYTAS
jgi:hypothetical protein